MKIDVSDIISRPGAKKELCLKLAEPLEGLSLEGPVDLQLEIVSGGRGVLSVQGTVKAKVFLTCSRCASQYCEPIEAEVQERFYPEGSRELEHEDEVGLDELCAFPYTEGELSLEEIARDNLLASLPYRPLCSQECRGVCPQCGQNLNEKACECGSAQEEIDPRWGALKKFSSGSPQ